VLEIRTRDKYPRYWAETRYNLALALRELGKLAGGDERKRMEVEAEQIEREAEGK
jgi:hypothetical protein